MSTLLDDDDDDDDDDDTMTTCETRRRRGRDAMGIEDFGQTRVLYREKSPNQSTSTLSSVLLVEAGRVYEGGRDLSQVSSDHGSSVAKTHSICICSLVHISCSARG